MKQIAYVMLILLAVTALTGCLAGEGFADYMAAINKTDNMQKGVSRIEVEVLSDLNEQLLVKLSEEERNQVKGLENIKVVLEDHFDREVSKRIMDVYFYQNALGMDLKLYQLGPNELYLKIPFMKGTFAIADALNQRYMSEDTIEALFDMIGQKWNGMLSAENVFVGEKTLIKNADGDIKATRFTVKPTSGQLAAFMKQLETLLLENYQVVIELIENTNNESIAGELTEDVYRELIQAVFSSLTITRYEEVAYMNLDGYMVDETIEIEIEYTANNTFENIFKGQTIRIKNNKWAIERSPSLDFSAINLEDVKPMESLLNGGMDDDR